jgi:hypothetical protein
MIYKPIYFDLEELVCKDVFDHYGQTAWQFFDPRLLETIDHLREKLVKAIFVNNWKEGGNLDERGFRCLKCQTVKDNYNKDYCSTHMRGQAIDFDVQGLLAEEVRQWIIKNNNFLKYPIRLEKDVSWVHLDVIDCGKLVYLFNK